MADSAREHDIVVYGATGFVGVLTAGYLAERAPAGVRIALAARSQEKLEKLRGELGVEWPLVTADSQDRDAVAALAGAASVVATTVISTPSAIRHGRFATSSSVAGSRRSSWAPSTPASFGAAMRFRATPMADGSATGS